MRKQGTIFLNSEQKIIYAEKRVNNFLNNDEQRIILCRMLEIVYVENSEQFLWENTEQFYLLQKKKRFYECNKQIRIYSKHDGQSENFINIETDFINTDKFDYCEIQTWKSIQIWRLDLEKMISLGVLWENSKRFFK